MAQRVDIRGSGTTALHNPATKWDLDPHSMPKLEKMVLGAKENQTEFDEDSEEEMGEHSEGSSESDSDSETDIESEEIADSARKCLGTYQDDVQFRVRPTGPTPRAASTASAMASPQQPLAQPTPSGWAMPPQQLQIQPSQMENNVLTSEVMNKIMALVKQEGESSQLGVLADRKGLEHRRKVILKQLKLMANVLPFL